MIVAGGGRRFEQCLRYGHESEAGTPLPETKADRQAQTIFVEKEKIVEIPANFSCRNQSRIEIKFVPIRERGKDFGTMLIWISWAIFNSLSIRSLAAVVFLR